MSDGGIQAGVVLGQTYRLVELIGRGGMGAVWMAEHVRLPKQVAVKVLHAAPDTQSQDFIRFRREAEIASRLGHPNIVEVFDFNVHDNGEPYIVMELLNGENLGQRLRRGTIPVAATLPIVRQIASALDAAHSNDVVHRDLKPANIFLCPRDVGGVLAHDVKVLDFGISKILGSQSVYTSTNEMVGTPQYMSPEQATTHGGPIGPHTDQFTLALVVYEMLTGQPAFQGSSLASVVFRLVHEEPKPVSECGVDVPENVIEALNRAMSKSPADRFKSMSDLVEALTGSALLPVTQRTGKSSEADTLPFLGESDEIAFDPTLDSSRPTDLAAMVSEANAVTGYPVLDAPMPDSRVEALPGQKASRSSGATLFGGMFLVAGAFIGALLPWGHWLGGSERTLKDPVQSDRQSQDVVPGDELQVKTPPANSGKQPAPKAPSANSPTAEMKPPALTPTVARGERRDANNAGRKSRMTLERKTVKTPVSVSPKVRPGVGKKSSAKSKDPSNSSKTKKLPDDVAGDLREAERALAAGQYAKAYRLARRTLHRKRTGRAVFIMARVKCAQKDLGGARALRHQLSGSYRRALIRYCKKKGLDLN